MNIECMGDCLKCEYLTNGDVDLRCPSRMLMLRTSRIEKTLSQIIEIVKNKKEVINIDTVTEVEQKTELI